MASFGSGAEGASARGWLRHIAMGAVLLASVACVTSGEKTAAMTTAATRVPDEGAHRFLEEVEGEAALAWVRAQNSRSLGLIEADPRYRRNYDAALQVQMSEDRIPYGAIRRGYVYNFWQDRDHERGLWRRTTLADYARQEPAWEPLLDLDAVAKAEGANWVYKGVQCRPPEYVDCLVSLSDGGKDAVRVREYSIREGAGKAGFVSGGFDLPEAKTVAVWESPDSLLVATDWGEGTLTASGYPFVVKRLRRGQALSEAVEVFRGNRDHIGAYPVVLEDASGQRWFGVSLAETFFTASHYVFDASGEPVPLPVPKKSTPRGLFRDSLVLSLEEDWTIPGHGEFRKGDLVSFGWSAYLAKRSLPAVDLVFRPGERQALQGVSVTSKEMLVSLSDQVATKVVAWTRGPDGWTSREIPLPPGGSAGVVFASETESTAFLSYEGFLSPDTLYAWDSSTAELGTLRRLPEWFDASAMVVEQFEATSRDKTRVPYFVVRDKNLAFDGTNPTLLYGYGGFQVSQTPAYSGTIGRLWLEAGGVYVLANIRGGGEFGPAWHQAGLKTKRQVVYDDFIAIAEDLVARRITSPRHLGIMGGSNGGLLMGVMYTQRPDLFGAIVCQVPLLDMLRYHRLLAGASWMDEYGDPEVPEERAVLASYSPYHNVDPATVYPEIFLLTSTKDDRVHPGHARKMAKRLEDLGKPFLYYENIDGGHSAAANLRETARRVALEFTWLSRRLMDAE